MARERLSPPERREFEHLAKLAALANWFVLITLPIYAVFNRGVPWGSLGLFMAVFLLYSLLYARWRPAGDRELRRRALVGFEVGAVLVTPALALTGGLQSPLVIYYFPTILGTGLGFGLRKALTQSGVVIAMYLLLALTRIGFWLHPLASLASGLGVALFLFFAAILTAAMGNLFRQDRRRLYRDARRADLLARTDPLTGLWNRREYAERLEREFSRSTRHAHPLSLVMFDLDGFKALNDREGHAVGDEILRRVGTLLRGELRQEDVAARYGGDEMVLLLPDTPQAMALLAAERLRRQIERDLAPWGVTASMGIATYPSPQISSAERLLQAADAALYLAKSRGRNRVQAAEAEIPHAL